MYGIDFGTSNTVVSTKNSNGQIELLKIGQTGAVIPSLLYLDKNGKISVGESAIADYSNSLEKWSLEKQPYDYFRFLQALKLALKDKGFIGSNIFGKIWTIEELVGVLLADVKKRSDKITGRDEKSVVIGRPVELANDSKTDKLLENRLKEAAFLAGFTNVSFVYEPVAAIVSTGAKNGERVLIFDFGGGTLDISIAKFENNNAKIITSVGTDLGGYTISERISKAKIAKNFGSGSTYTTLDGKCLQVPHHLTEQVTSFYALPLSNISGTRKMLHKLIKESNDKNKLLGLDQFLSQNMSYQLFKSIDDTKIELSSKNSSKISFKIKNYINFTENLNRLEFEEIIEEEVATASKLIEKALNESKLSAADINKVIRVGGSSQIPVFKALLEEKFPGKVKEGDLFNSISSGLINAYEQGLTAPK